MINFFHPVLTAAKQNLATEIKKGAQHLFHGTDARCDPIDQNIHVQAKAHLKVRVSIKHAHQHIGIHIL